MSKVSLGGGFAIYPNISETGLVNIVLLSVGLVHLLGPILCKSMASRGKDITEDIEGATAKFKKATERLAEAQKAKAQAAEVTAEILASIETDKVEFEKTTTAQTQRMLERQAVVAENTLKEMQVIAESRAETHAKEESINRRPSPLALMSVIPLCKSLERLGPDDNQIPGFAVEDLRQSCLKAKKFGSGTSLKHQLHVATFKAEDRNGLYMHTALLQWSLTQFTLAPMEMVPPNASERAFTACVLLSGLMTLSTLVPVITTTLTKFRQPNQERFGQRVKHRSFLSERRITVDLSNRIQAFLQKQEPPVPRSVQEAEVATFKRLSDRLARDLHCVIYAPCSCCGSSSSSSSARAT